MKDLQPRGCWGCLCPSPSIFFRLHKWKKLGQPPGYSYFSKGSSQNKTKPKSIKTSDCCRLCMESPETSQNSSKFKIPWGNRLCFITSRGAGDSGRGGSTHAETLEERGYGGNSPTGCEGERQGPRHSQTCSRARGEQYLCLRSHFCPVGTMPMTPGGCSGWRSWVCAGSASFLEVRDPLLEERSECQELSLLFGKSKHPNPTAVSMLLHDGHGTPRHWELGSKKIF